MRKEVILTTLLLVFLISFVLGLSVEINTEIDGEAGSFFLETDSSANSGFDTYDIEVPSHVDNNYAQLYSVVGGRELLLDAFAEQQDRTVNLVYDIGSLVNESEGISFSWDTSDFTDYQATLYDYGNSSSRMDLITNIDMDNSGSYSSSSIENGFDPRYFSIVLLYDPADITVPGGGSSGGSGVGGGGGGGLLVLSGLEFNPTEINVDLVVDKTREFILKVKNSEDFGRTVSFDQTGLDNLVMMEDKIEFGPGEEKEIILKFVAPNATGIYAGNVLAGGNKIPTTLNVRSKDLLFDAMIVVPDGFKKVKSSDDLETQVTLIPMGDEDERVDVTLNYVIRDFDGNVYLIESETILVDSQKTFKKTFNINSLVSGNYLIGLELVYPSGVATSSSHFAVISGISYMLEIIILSSIVLLILIVMIFWRLSLKSKKPKIKSSGVKK